MAGKVRIIVFVGMALCMALFLRSPALASQLPQFRIDIDRLNLQRGVSTNLVISLTNASGAQIASVEGLEHFEVVSQNQSSYTSITGGVTTQQIDVQVVIMPKEVGTFVLQAYILYDRQYYETNALRVTVTEGADESGESVTDLFIKTIVSHEEAYLGEKIVVTYELYSRYNVQSFGFTDYLAVDGMMVREMPDDYSQSEYVYIGGNRYAKYVVRKLVVDPIKAGMNILPSFNFQVNVMTDGGRGFGGLLFSSQAVYLQTDSRELNVKPLPSEGKPANFSGIVGELSLESHYSREQMNIGDSFLLQVTATGNCNLDGVRNIIGGSIPGITMYETQKHTTEEIQENQYHVQKVFEVIMVPDTTGNITIEPISVPYFNPLTGKYESAEIPGTIIEVLGELSQINYGGQFKNAPVETVRITQVSYAYLDKEYFSFQIKKDTFFVILIGALAVIVLAFGLLALAKNGKKRDPVLKSLYKRLISTQESDEMYDIFNDMVKHCYRVSVKANSQSAIINSLPDNGLATQAIEIMGYMESPQFREGKGHAHLREMIKGAFKTMTNSKHTMAHHIA